MMMIKELLTTDVGVLSLLSIVFMIVMSIYLYLWVEKKIKEDTVKHEKEQRAALKAK
ncbi:MAG: DUF3149 domain-containing protein [Burkholderiales bacterium]|jgi:hypothetical protein|nr:DUF3149 domain-containing protein [Burkholderiales bacterium]